MGKQRDSYNKSKPTNRQIKKQKKMMMIKLMIKIKFNKIREFLEKKWNNTVTYNCGFCLQEAYYSELNNTQGYVTDEDLIVSSNHKLKPK
jgi:hypothetical protein